MSSTRRTTHRMAGVEKKDKMLGAGLSKQAAQATVRVWTSSVAEYTLRGAYIRPGKACEFDRKLENWFAKAVGVQAKDLTDMDRKQIFLPMRLGGALLEVWPGDRLLLTWRGVRKHGLWRVVFWADGSTGQRPCRK